MGMPEINIRFKELGVSSIQRSGRGVVALILKDNTATSQEYKRLDRVNEADFTADNYDYIQNAFKGVPSKVIVEVINEATGTVSDAIKGLENKRFNYLAMPEATAEEQTQLVSFIKTAREQDKKTFKLVAANEVADSELIINFTAQDIETEDRTYTTQEFTTRIAGILAGISLNRSATYYVLPEVISITSKDDPDAAIDAGELILVDDGEKIKVGRAVNSLVTTTEDKNESYQKIKIVEGMHLAEEDIRNTYEDEYVGKYINDYDNKVLFVAAVNNYLRELERSYVLDRSYNNVVGISLEAQRLFMESKGIPTDKYSDQQIKEYNTGAKVFMDGNLKFVDAMEDLDFNIYI